MKKFLNMIPPVFLILLLSLLGFVTGIVTIALWQENWLIGDKILNQEFVCQINSINIDKRALFFLCLGRRLRAFCILFFLAFSTVNLFSNILFFFLHGLYIGSVMELCVIRYGGQGILMYLSFVLPQGIFYCVGFILLGCWCLNLEKNVTYLSSRKIDKIKKWKNKGRVLASFFIILVGIILESYINTEIFLFFL